MVHENGVAQSLTIGCIRVRGSDLHGRGCMHGQCRYIAGWDNNSEYSTELHCSITNSVACTGAVLAQADGSPHKQPPRPAWRVPAMDPTDNLSLVN